MALNNVTIITTTPVPICANKGPGHAPIIFQPNPKINLPSNLTFIESLGRDYDPFTIDGFDIEFLNHPNRNHLN